jgi:hypothetical protein
MEFHFLDLAFYFNLPWLPKAAIQLEMLHLWRWHIRQELLLARRQQGKKDGGSSRPCAEAAPPCWGGK